VSIECVEIAGLTTRIVGRPDAALTAILLHGFGAPGDDLVALASILGRGESGARIRFVFPEAPLELSGMFGARAWWLLDLVKLEQELRAGTPRDRSAELPAGLPEARTQLGRFVDQVQARFGTDRIVLGGFSQGAMLALDVALHREAAPAGIVIMSGTIVAEQAWTPRLHKLAGVPVFQSHGRTDMLLPYKVAETLRDKLRAAGALVEWHPFVGGHEIPTMVLAELGMFFAAR
jgi:phospholipase/carboxylesterase